MISHFNLLKNFLVKRVKCDRMALGIFPSVGICDGKVKNESYKGKKEVHSNG